jgi:hypothetical protein
VGDRAFSPEEHGGDCQDCHKCQNCQIEMQQRGAMDEFPEEIAKIEIAKKMLDDE